MQTFRPVLQVKLEVLVTCFLTLLTVFLLRFFFLLFEAVHNTSFLEPLLSCYSDLDSA